MWGRGVVPARGEPPKGGRGNAPKEYVGKVMQCMLLLMLLHAIIPCNYASLISYRVYYYPQNNEIIFQSCFQHLI